MKLTLEHAIIGVLALALIYYVIQHRNVLTDLVRIPDRGHPELKAVKDKHRFGRGSNFFNPKRRLLAEQIAYGTNW